MKRELIISQEGNELDISEYLTKSLHKNGLVIDISGTLSEKILENHINLSGWLNLNTEIAIEIDKISCEISQSWYSTEKKYKFKGVLIGDMIAYEVMQLLVSTIKYAIIFEKIYEEFKPHSLLLVDDQKPLTQTFTLLAKSFGLNVRLLSSNRLSEPSISFHKQLYHFLKESRCNFFEFIHKGQNVFLNIRKAFKPGFRMSKGMECILFDPYHGYENLLPTLVGRSCKNIIIPRHNFRTAHPSSYYQKLFGTPTKHFRVKRITPKQNELSEQWQKLAPLWDKIETPNNFLFLKKAWLNLILSHRVQCKSYIYKACSDICTAEIIINKYKVVGTVLPFDEFGLYKALVLIGKKNHHINIIYQHGILCRYPAMIPPTSEKIIVWDSNSLNYLISRKVPEFKIEKLSNPIVWQLKEKTQKINKRFIKNKLRLNRIQPVVFYAAQPFVGISSMDNPAEVRQTINKVFELSFIFPEFFFLIKLHPNDALSQKFEQLSKSIELRKLSNVRMILSTSSHDLIIASDIVIAETSTVLWEATIMNRLAIAFLDRDFVKQVSPYNSNPRVISVRSFDALTKILQKVLNKETLLSNYSIDTKTESSESNIAVKGYFNDHRWDLFSLVPQNANSILDIGCGDGWLARQLKLTRTCSVTGIEMNTSSGEKASKILNKVFIQDIEQFSFPFTKKSFDCIILGDILEHLKNPWGILQKLVWFLKDDGFIIISIPNIGHYTTLLSLFKGKFEYTNEGILDKTHLRFFTLQGICDLLEKADLKPVRILHNTHSGRILQTANILLNKKVKNLIAFQYVIVAKQIV